MSISKSGGDQPIKPLGTERASTDNYEVSNYTDNWSYWNAEHKQEYPTTPEGARVEVGFAVVTPDGSFDERYPLGPGKDQWTQGAPPNGYAFAVGGWNNSQPSADPSSNPAFGGLYSVMSNPDPGPRQALINNIVESAQKYGYKSVTMDFEAFGHPELKDTYTQFMLDLGQACHNASPPLKCGMAISPDKANQSYFDLSKIANDSNIDTIQLMTYDYGRGLSPDQNGQVPVTANASVAQTAKYLKAAIKVIPEDKISVGAPFYGIKYKLDPSLSKDEVQAQLAKGTLKGSYDVDPSVGDPSITDDDLKKEIGDWQSPQNGWQLLDDGGSPPAYYYYNEDQNALVSAFPPQEITHFVNMLKEQFPQVHKVFGYEGQGDFQGTMLADMMKKLNG